MLSDSGGVLEEAETLGLPVLVTREVTERAEAFSTGMACLIGFDSDKILSEARTLLDAAPSIPAFGRPLRRTFGDGRAAERILRITRDHLAVGTGIDSFEPSLSNAA